MRIFRYINFLFLIIILFSSCQFGEKTLFKKIEPAESGILFNNEITENDTLNILESEFVYNGAGRSHWRSK